MQCPKCGSGVPEGSTQCHICFAPLDAEAPKGPTGLQVPQVRESAPDEIEPGIPGITRPPGVSSEPLGGAAEPRPNYLSPTTEPTPNYMAPGPGAAPPMGGGAVRVSLTGEVIEVPGAAPAQPMGYPQPVPLQPMGYPPQGPPQPMGYAPAGPPQQMPPPGRARRPGVPPPTGQARTSYTRPGPYQAARSSSGGGGKVLLVVILLLLILGGAGAGGWWWYNNRTNPKDQALAAYKAVSATDWKGLYPLLALSDADRAKAPDAEAFAREAQAGVEKQPNASFGLQILHSLSDISVGEPVVTGDRADVPTSAKLKLAGMEMNLRGTAHMVKERGIWKLDATQGGYAGAKLGMDLLGKPDNMPAGMGLGLGTGSRPGGTSGSGRPGRRNR